MTTTATTTTVESADPPVRQVTYLVRDIKPNPFRNLERHPLNPEKVSALRESIRVTGLWPNLLARIGEDGKPELVYGHHRLEALRLEFPKAESLAVPVTIENNLNDRLMLARMVRENAEAWHTDAEVDLAAVRAVVEAYGAGKITLPSPHPKTPKSAMRHAPSFCRGDVAGHDRRHPYTVSSLVEILGWEPTKIEDTLAALELQERGLVPTFLYSNVTQRKARFITRKVSRWVTAHTESADRWERKSCGAQKLAEQAKNDDDRQKYRTQAEEFAKAAATDRAQVTPEFCADVANKARFCFNVGDASVDKEWRRQQKLLNGPDVFDNERTDVPSGGRGFELSGLVDHYLEILNQCIAGVRQVRRHAALFSPEQISKARQEHRILREDLESLEHVLKVDARARYQRLADDGVTRGLLSQIVGT